MSCSHGEVAQGRLGVHYPRRNPVAGNPVLGPARGATSCQAVGSQRVVTDSEGEPQPPSLRAPAFPCVLISLPKPGSLGHSEASVSWFPDPRTLLISQAVVGGGVGI